MVLSITSRFHYVVFSIAPLPYGYISTFYYYLEDGTFKSHGLPRRTGDTVSAEAIADLAILEEIYNSADGFLDADGNSISITFTHLLQRKKLSLNFIIYLM